MENTQQLAKRFEEVILNGTWISNTNYKDQLDGLDWKIATKPFASYNTIAVLAQHIHYYIHGVKNVFEGGDLEIRDAYSFDFPPITSQQQWEVFLDRFWKDTEDLVSLIAQTPDKKLDDAFVDKKYGNYARNINGIIEHCYYHLGQIVLLKKIATGAR